MMTPRNETSGMKVIDYRQHYKDRIAEALKKKEKPSVKDLRSMPINKHEVYINLEQPPKRLSADLDLSKGSTEELNARQITSGSVASRMNVKKRHVPTEFRRPDLNPNTIVP